MIYALFPGACVADRSEEEAIGLEVRVGTMPSSPGIWVLEGSGPMGLAELAALDTLFNSFIPQPPMAQGRWQLVRLLGWVSPGARTPSLPVTPTSPGMWRWDPQPYPAASRFPGLNLESSLSLQLPFPK